MINEFIRFFNNYGICLLSSRYLASRDSFTTKSGGYKFYVKEFRNITMDIVKEGIAKLRMGKVMKFDGYMRTYIDDIDHPLAQLEKSEFMDTEEWKLTVYPRSKDENYKMVTISFDKYSGNIKLGSLYGERNATICYNPQDSKQNYIF